MGAFASFSSGAALGFGFVFLCFGSLESGNMLMSGAILLSASAVSFSIQSRKL